MRGERTYAQAWWRPQCAESGHERYRADSITSGSRHQGLLIWHRTVEVMKIIIGSTHRPRRGQALVEFALVLTIAVIVLFVSIQLALIGQLYLALGQMNYRGVRYAAISPTCIDEKTPCGMSNQSIT